MKNFYFTTVFVALSLIIVSCGKKAERAADYNNAIISHQMRIIEALDIMDSTLRDSTINDERLDYAIANLQAKVKYAVLAIDSIGPFDQDPSFQQSAKELFRSYETMADEDYAKLVAIRRLPPQAITSEVVDTNNAVLLRLHSRSEAIQNKFIKSQEEFGKKYNLSFE